MNKKKYCLTPSEEVSEKGNLLIFALSIKEFYKNGMFLEVTLPMTIIDNISREEFNSFFTEILFDVKITDDNIKIRVTPDHYFEAKVC
jgi:hypothetical protein